MDTNNIQDKSVQINTEKFSFSKTCERSEKIDSLAKALSKAQAQMELAEKNADNPFFKSSYADLSAIIKAAKKPLADNGLAISQLLHPSEIVAIVTTVLMHDSGQYITSTIQLKPKVNDPQGMGSAITYARRYAYGSIIGLSAEDDDANEASKKHSPPPAFKKEYSQASEKQIKTIRENLQKKGKTEEEIIEAYKIKKLENLNTAQASKVIGRLFSMPDIKREDEPDIDEVDRGIEAQKGEETHA